MIEPACGDGNFLVEILRRKLEVAKRRATPPRKKKPLPLEFEKQSVIAMTSIYGVDILMDNVIACRNRLYDIWNAEYESICKKEINPECQEAVRFILSRNILCGNALSMKMVNEDGEDTDDPIIFSEWSFVMGDKMQRKDYRFDKLLAGEYAPGKEKIEEKSEKDSAYQQMDMLSMINEKPSDEGEFLTSYVADYRRIHHNAK